MLDSLTIAKKGKCCACGQKLTTSRFINFMELDYLPTWQFPVSINLLLENQPRRALAIVCDRCIVEKKTPIKVIEFRNRNIFYHKTEDLVAIGISVVSA
jgi:hypothetical protein